MTKQDLKFMLRDFTFIELPLGKFKKKPKPRKCRRKYKTPAQIEFELKVKRIKEVAEMI